MSIQMVIRSMTISLLLAALLGCMQAKLFLINGLARWDDYTLIPDIAYGGQALNHLDLYLPPADKSKHVTVIFFYGGCWGGCELLPKQHYRFVAQALTAQGYTVVIPDYRHHPEVKFAVIMEDAAKIVLWADKHIADFGGGKEPLFLMGHSAGAHIAAMLTLNENYLKPAVYDHIKGFIGLAGPYDFLPMTDEYQKVVFGPVANYPATQPVNFVGGTEPPLLLLYGQGDETVKPVNIASLRQKVQHAGGCVETHEYSDLGHAFLLGALSLPFQEQEPVLTDIVQFLDYYAQPNQPCKS
ncbi:MAG: alpha/beta hydrolase [Methylococcales bacterium]